MPEDFESRLEFDEIYDSITEESLIVQPTVPQKITIVLHPGVECINDHTHLQSHKKPPLVPRKRGNICKECGHLLKCPKVGHPYEKGKKSCCAKPHEHLPKCKIRECYIAKKVQIPNFELNEGHYCQPCSCIADPVNVSP